MAEERDVGLPPPPKISRRKFLWGALAAAAAAAAAVVAPGSIIRGRPQGVRMEPEQPLSEEEALKKEVEGYNDNILNPEEGTDWRELAEKRQLALLNLLQKYPETTGPLVRSAENVQAREVLTRHLDESGIRDRKDLELLLEEDFRNWAGAVGLITGPTSKAKQEWYFQLLDEGGREPDRTFTNFKLHTSEPIEQAPADENVTIDGIRVRGEILADPIIVPRTDAPHGTLRSA